MNRRNDLKLPKKRYLVIGIGICIGLIALSLKVEGAVKPIKNSLSSVTTPVQSQMNEKGNWLIDHVSFLSNIANIKKENDALREKIKELDKKVSQMEKEETELKRLRKLLELSEKYDEYPTVGANVIGRGPGNWFDTIVIDKGKKDGIEEGMNVLAGDGLVGIVTEVQNSSSTIMSIIDDGSNVSAMSLETGDICMVNGNQEMMEKGYIGVEDIDKEAKVKEGEKMITSNISSKYLAGLTIGTIKDIELSDSKLSKTAKLEPVVDFKHLQEVLIIKKVKTEEETETSKNAKNEDKKETKQEKSKTETKKTGKEEE